MYRYRCDICGCYLDPNEGRMCDECRAAIDRRGQRMRRVSEAVRVNDSNQYEMILQEVG